VEQVSSIVPDDEEKILKPGYTVDVYFTDKELE